ncbi:MAG: tripartite tricarboxylate transporter substrate binding protein [Lautropia sp.]|nr:tripartite tricarboxylate transporter substrate binding protein [Lautropia sp.]
MKQKRLSRLAAGFAVCRHRAILVLLAAICSLGYGIAAAAEWPERPVRLIVAFPPGGSTDMAARVLAEKLSEVLRQPVIVENKAGASGNIGADAVARAPADGYTLLMAATSFATSPAFFPNLSWSPTRDFAPVSMVASVPIVVVVNNDLPVRSIADLIAYARQNPNKLNLASPGAATLTRLSGEMFRLKAGVEWTTVHYKGGVPAVQDMLGGVAQVMFANASDVMSFVNAGRLRALAVTSGKRSEVLPQLPTVAEGGVAGFDVATWQAVMAPAGTPAPVIDRLNREIAGIMAMPDVKQKFHSFGTDVSTSSPGELGRFLEKEVAAIGTIVKQVGAKID